MTDDERDTQLRQTVAKLRDSIDVPPADPERARALLAAFDAHWARPPRTGRRAVWVWTAAAASLVFALAIGRLVVTDAPSVDEMTRDAVGDLSGFVPWPGAEALPPLESGELRRIELPRSILPALGLSVPTSAVAVVAADIVIGQDGLARAVRLVHQQ